MDRIKWAFFGAITALGIAAGAYYMGRSQCPKCAEFDRAVVLSDLLIPTQKLLLTESVATHRFDWNLVSTWPKIADWASKIGLRKMASGYLEYRVLSSYGYDLSQRTNWSLKRQGEKFVFEAPPLKLLACPVVLTQTILFKVEETSHFVQELRCQDEVIRTATAHALALAHDGLRETASAEKIKKTVDQELRSLLVSLSRPMGWAINASDIEIHNPKGAFDVPAAWKPELSEGRALDQATLEQLERAGCV